MVAKLGSARQTSRKLRIAAWPLSAPFAICGAAVPECPICRQSYDGQFQVFVPPHNEAFDTVACARRAAEVRDWDKTAPVPVILPMIESVYARSEAPVATVARRRRVAALAGFDLAHGQAALATGVGLLAAGTAASIYLWARPGATTPASQIAAGAPTTRQIIPTPRQINGQPLVEAPPAVADSPQTRPAAHARPAVSRSNLVAFIDTGSSPGTASDKSAETALAKAAVRPAPSTSPAESPVSAPTRAPKLPPSTPKAPPVTPKPPTASPPPSTPAPPSVNPPAPVEPPLSGEGGISPADNPSPQQPPARKPPPPTPPPPTAPPAGKPPPPTAPPPTTQPPTSPGEDADDDDEDSTRPGNGWGDRNHDHTGPPGQNNRREREHGNGHGC